MSRFFEENKPKPVESVDSPSEPVVIKTEIVQLTKILPKYKKLTLDNEEDVLSYIDSVKDKLLFEVRNNKKISL